MNLGWSSLLLALLAAPGPTVQDSPFEGRAIRELYLGLPPGTRVEYFRLDRESLLDEAERIPGASGLVRWIVGPDPEREEAWRVELEASFFHGETRVIHTERLQPRMRELVFREVRAQAGRTLYLTWDPEVGVRSLEMMGGELRREELDPGRGTLFPLSLVEMVRRGVDFQGSVSVFQPLVGAPEELELAVRDDGAERVLELRRGDLSAGSYRFRETQLVSFRWQEGGPVATRISRAQYEALLTTRNEQLATPVAAEESSD